MKKLALILGMLIMAAGTVWFLNNSGQDKGTTGPIIDDSKISHTKDIESQIDKLKSNQWNKEQKDIYAGKSRAKEEDPGKKVSTPVNKESKIQKKTDDKVKSEKPEDAAAKKTTGDKGQKGYKEYKLETLKALDEYKKDKEYNEKKYGYYYKRIQNLNNKMAEPKRLKELNKIIDELRGEGIIK